MAAGLSVLPKLHPVEGIRLGACAAGIRYPDRLDLVLIETAADTKAAAVFTRNRFCAAPVIVARDHLAASPPRALLINTGYANAGMGEIGLRDALACCRAVANRLGCKDAEVMPFSTGVIGGRLPVDRIVNALPACVERLGESEWADAAHGIMTTDSVAKGASRQFKLGSETVTLTGIAKGAGMIRPDMATMLAFIATDAALNPQALQESLRRAVARSFNRITVDGDTSTNDACILLATGRSAAKVGAVDSDSFEQFAAVVSQLCTELAQALVRDAEGATKFITIEVVEGASEADCLEVAYTIAHSPLVKTAFFASDPNWGRILAAVGRAGIHALNLSAVSIDLDDVRVISDGALAPEYTEARGQRVMRKPEITVRVALGSGSSSARIWTSDLSHEYVQINAEYRS
ncbi:MAG: bifunctional glutamate N-acetyltransferase/amino-acid acetyltransferase ArgJ [Nitrospira sp.]|nr:bifunctional glutamate N-acetyltransferase/amino-acid acetyltransferase ArgJ [Nitrospira sp.]